MPGNPNFGKEYGFKKGEARASENGKKGRAIRAEKARERKSLAQVLLYELGKKGVQEEICAMLISRAKRSDKAFEVLRDTIGEKPTDKFAPNVTILLENAEKYGV